VVEATAESFGYALVSLYLLQGETLYLQHQVGYATTINEIPISKGIIGLVARTGQPILAQDCRSHPEFIAAQPNLSSEVCVPIIQNERVVGILNVETEAPQQLTSNDLEIMTTLSEHVGIAMERAELYTAVQESNHKYEMVVDNIREAIFQVDLQGKMTFLNKAWSSLSGYAVEESLGKHFSQFIYEPEIKRLYEAQRSQTFNDPKSDVRLQSLLLRPDGGLVPIEAHLQRIYSPDGTPLGWGGTIMDVSDRVQAEKKAREMRLLVQVQEAISTKLNLKDMIQSVVETTAGIFGYELVSIYLLKGDRLVLQHQVGYKNVIEQFPITIGVAGRVMLTKKPALIEDAASDPDFLFAEKEMTSEICVPLMQKSEAIGTLIVESRMNKRFNQDDLNMLVTLGEQISLAVERAQLYTALQESNQKYQMVVDNVREVIFQTDLTGNIAFLSKAWERITGFSIAESMGKPFVEYTTPDQHDYVQQKGQEVIQTAQPYVQFQTTIISADNVRIPLEVQIQRIYDVEGRLIGIGGTSVDITEQIQAKKHEQELGLLVEVRAAISSKFDLKDTIRTIVEATAEAFGYDLVSVYLLRGDTLHLQHQIGYEILFDPVDTSVGVSGRVARTGIPALVQDTLNDPDFVNAINAITSEVCVPLLNNGKIIGIMNVESKSKLLTESDLHLMISLSEHVTIAVERAQLYTAVVESNQKYQMVVNSIQEVIFQLDLYGIITFLNDAWVQLTGYPLENSIGKHFSTFIPHEGRESSKALADLLLVGNQAGIHGQIILAKYDQTYIPVEIHIQQVYNVDGEPMGVGGTITDISERMQAEKQALDLMLKARTVEMLKGFLTGVSHDLRTPLSIMNTSLYLLRHKLGETQGENRHLDALEKQTSHMQRVVEDMLDMSKLDDDVAELSLIRIDLNGLVRDLLVTLQNSANAKSQQLIFSPTSDDLFIMADQFMLGKVITNVVKNAIQYTPDGGHIHIDTFQMPDFTVKIIVKDSGIGIEADTLPHIFERFYKANEARPSGQVGAGLGLSIARRIVEMHSGSIEAQSTVGVGSIFTITLPIGQ
jgi:PAS domain S-box-containing protein